MRPLISHRPAIRPRLNFDSRILAFVLVILVAGAFEAFAQAKPRPRRPSQPPLPPPTLDIGGYAMVGLFNFAAADSFDAILGSPSGTIYGGGVRVGLPVGGLFVDVGAWRFRGEGDRVFLFGGEEFPLNIPIAITITPLELTAGWQFRFRRAPRFRPYVGGGLTSYHYEESSEFSTGVENVADRFNGYHVLGGGEYRIARWIAIGADATWTTVPDAIGVGGVSEAFDERDLGGTSVRVKITIGR
jgi:hypothetical protein